MTGHPGMPTHLLNGPPDAKARLVLAHGAGAGMNSQFLELLAATLGEAEVEIMRFEFGYMAARRADGVRRPPPRMPILEAEYRDLIMDMTPRKGQRLYIGGKSMGGRVASLIADGLYFCGRIAGLVVVGYPFHPPRKPASLRVEHLATLACPTLIVQGDRDALGSKDEVADYTLSPSIRVHWLEDGDHDLTPRRASGATRAAHVATAACEIARFMALP